MNNNENENLLIKEQEVKLTIFLMRPSETPWWCRNLCLIHLQLSPELKQHADRRRQSCTRRSSIEDWCHLIISDELLLEDLVTVSPPFSPRLYARVSGIAHISLSSCNGAPERQVWSSDVTAFESACMLSGTLLQWSRPMCAQRINTNTSGFSLNTDRRVQILQYRECGGLTNKVAVAKETYSHIYK